jgi:hypothetical protein
MSEPERLTVNQTADALDITPKAVQQALARDAFPNVEREPRGKSVRVWIPRSDVEAYDRTRRRSRTRRRTSRAAPVAADPSRSTQTQFLWHGPPERAELLQAVIEAQEAPEDRKRIAALLRQVADLLER